jgi:ribosome maturation factor RimP
VGLAHFFFATNPMEDLKNDIQQQLHDLDSQIELVALERPGSEALRLFVDHPDGVDLALCERVTKHLSHLLVDYSLEVSSPGPKYRRPSPVPDSSRVREGEPEEVQ